MSNNILVKRRVPLSVTAALLASFVALAPAESQAGGYIGGSVGQAYIEVDAGTPIVPQTFDEDDFNLPPTNFIAAYCDFLLAAVILLDSKLYTLALGLRLFLEGDFSTNWPEFCAAALLGAIPIILIFF